MAYGEQYNRDFYQSNLTLDAEDGQEQQLPPQQYAQQQQWGQTGYPYGAYVGSTPGYPAGNPYPAPSPMETEGFGQMDTSGHPSAGGEGTSFDDELPLLEELGINFEVIKQKTISVLNPLQNTNPTIMADLDLAGPLLFCLMYGTVLLLTGKAHFGYIYGMGLLGCSSMYIVLNLMSDVGVSAGCVISVLGYSLLPMVLLSCFSLVVHLQGIIGMILSVAIILWCSYSASRLFVHILHMNSQQLLVAYPCALLYGVFVLLTVF